MKQVVYGIVTAVMVFITVGIVMAVVGKTNRRADMDNALSISVEHAVETTMGEKTYTIADNEEFIADFTENLLLQISNDADMEIQVAGVDYEKGLLSVKVIEHFTHPNGNEGKNECETTVVFEQVPNETRWAIVTFLMDDGTLYKQYQIKEGDAVIVPKAPVIEGKKFVGWCIKDTPTIISDFGQATEDITYVAVFE